MAKLRDADIGKEDLVEFLNDHSDFAFELKVLKALVQLGFTCEHSGSYVDPSTNKIRAFDIRAMKSWKNLILRLAVECKNLKANYPLLVSCIDRHFQESFHEIVISRHPQRDGFVKYSDYGPKAFQTMSQNIRLTGLCALYKECRPTGKDCVQVGRTNVSGAIDASDSGIYDKWSQALSSADELIKQAHQDGNRFPRGLAHTLVIPMVIVPNHRLWTATFNEIGERIGDPEPVDRCSMFVNRRYVHRGLTRDNELTLSHLEFFTFDGLSKFVAGYFEGSDQRELYFALEEGLQMAVNSIEQFSFG